MENDTAQQAKFDKWMEKVNVQIASMSGLSADDIEDYGYWDAWDDGISPKSAARDALENAGL